MSSVGMPSLPPSAEAPALQPPQIPPPPMSSPTERSHGNGPFPKFVCEQDEVAIDAIVAAANPALLGLLGTAQLPSLGSALHHLGRCKPCAFQRTKGCSNGKDCCFCHLCPPGEKKRRQREKRQDKFSYNDDLMESLCGHDLMERLGGGQ